MNGPNLFLIYLLISLTPIASMAKDSKKNAHQFSFTALNDASKTIKLSDYDGKVIMIVNTASKCGFTPQYAFLEKLWREYKDRGLVILGIPSNDFAEQEPGSEKQIQEFCQKNYNVTFPMTSKQHVVGENANPLHRWLYLETGVEPKWNFQKFIIDKNGDVIGEFPSTTAPDNREIVKLIERELAVEV